MQVSLRIFIHYVADYELQGPPLPHYFSPTSILRMYYYYICFNECLV